MHEFRLKYEFAHGGMSDSVGYDPTFYNFTAFLDKPDNARFTFGIDPSQKDVYDSTAVTRAAVGGHRVFGDLHAYIKNWLITHPYSTINTILVKVTDVLANNGAGKSMGIWQIEESNITYCADSCELELMLDEYNPGLNCLESTLITDNHRNWFPPDGITWGLTDNITGLPLLPYIFPIFRYCDEIKPQAWSNFIFVFAQSVIGFLVSIVTPIVALDAILGGDLQEELEDKIEYFLQTYLGCNRMHPAPFVRQYFINACSKCGITFESDIFNSPGGTFSRYYNTAMAFAPARDGLRETQDVQTALKGYRNGNSPYITALEYAHTLKDIFNAKYRLEANVFKFNHKHSFPTTIVFDFTGADKNYLIGDICYEINNKIPASLLLKYAEDSKDLSGNQARHRYDGAVDWTEGMSDNDRKRFEGIVKIESQDYGCTRYASDGITKELAFNFDFGALSLVLGWAKNSMLLSSDFTSTYKLMIYDPESSMQDAAPLKTDITYYDPITDWTDDWIGESGFSLDTYYMYNAALAFSKKHSDNGHKNLYDLHKMDDPTISGIKRRSWNLEMDLCSAVIDRLITDSPEGLTAHLDHIVKLDAATFGYITYAEIDYDRHRIKLTGETKYV